MSNSVKIWAEQGADLLRGADLSRKEWALTDSHNLAGIADAPQQERTVRFEGLPDQSTAAASSQQVLPDMPTDDDSSIDGESRGGDTAASSTEEDIAKGELTAV